MAMVQTDRTGGGLGPPPPKRYKIGELAAYTGLTRQTLHNYTRWGLIRESGWTEGGHRLYDEQVFPVLSRIVALKRDHTIEQIRELLTEQSVDEPVPADATLFGPMDP